MKSIVLGIVMSGMVLLFGCSAFGSKDASPAFKSTNNFSVNSFLLKIKQDHNPDITYHSEQEMQQFIKNKVISLLKEEKLFSDKPPFNSLDIEFTYKRQFFGDKTPFPSDSLRYPSLSYDIKVSDGTKELTTISRNNLTLRSGLATNLKVVGGLLREKKDEVQFMNAAATFIFEEIKRMKK